MNSKTKNMFTPIKKNKRIFEILSSKIKDQIIEGALKPGDKLPTEGELATQFNVGRQTVREALRILELSGFISVRQGIGGGPIVRNNISAKITNLLINALQMGNISKEELSKARLLIETAIMDDAINEANNEDIKNLQENIATAKDLIAKKENPVDASFNFHLLLAKASKNKVFVIIEETICAIHRELRKRKPIDFKISIAAIQAHEEILNALIKKDRDKAISLIEEHIYLV